MRSPIWTLVERRLRRLLPAASQSAVLGDLAEDYVRQRAEVGHQAMRANPVTLLREE